ncbi:MAG: PEP/pyruvate-binding domain-containing protein, partial [Desulfonatronovibrio sp.]
MAKPTKQQDENNPSVKAGKKDGSGKNKKIEKIKSQLVLNAREIMDIGVEAELLVGGKNYNTAIMNTIENVRAPQFRAISANAFHKLLDETKVNAAVIREAVDREFDSIDWSDEAINNDSEFIRKFVRKLALKLKRNLKREGTLIKLRTFINNVVEGFAVSPEGI